MTFSIASSGPGLLSLFSTFLAETSSAFLGASYHVHIYTGLIVASVFIYLGGLILEHLWVVRGSTLLGFIGGAYALVWSIYSVTWYGLALFALMSTVSVFGFILTHPAEWEH